MRVLAHFSQDENLLKMFADGKDTHGSTAVNMFGLDCDPNDVKKLYPLLRQAAKTINFMLMYGGGAYTLYTSLRDDHFAPLDLADREYLEKYNVRKGEEVAQIYIDKYFDSYSGVAQFIKGQKKFAHKNEYVYTVLQRKRRLPDINSFDRGTVSYCERLSVNSVIQGSAADITMSAQNRIANDDWYEKHGALMLLQIHDELVFECPEEFVDECIERTKHYMSFPFGDNKSLNLPLSAEADSGDSYAEAK
jgi:DNA polymerase-1